MTWGELIGPAVVAAIVSGVISVVGMIVNRSTLIRMHGERLNKDEALADRKVAADIALAKQKFDYDRAQAVFRRRFELAEQLLADAYLFRSLMKHVRSGFSMGGEGESRPPQDGESQAVKRSRDNYFVPLERLRKEDDFLAAMFARRTSSQAHFGPDAENAFALFHEGLHLVRVASSLLIEWTRDHETVDGELMEKLRRDIWQPMAQHAGQDEIGGKIEEGVQIIERLCRPVLAWVGS